jgi:hypothetical protein
MTLKTLYAIGQVPDVALVMAHPAIVLIPIAALAFCLVDRDRRLQIWLVDNARFRVAVAATVIAILALEVFGQVDAQIPFVYFQF